MCNSINSLQSVFSNREISIGVWLLTIIVLLFIVNKESREAFIEIIKALFDKYIIVSLVIMVIYLCTVLLILSKFNLWDFSYLKDTVIWFMFTGFFILMKLGKIKSNEFYKNDIQNLLKVTLLVEFVTNFYSFTLPIELLLIPIVAVLSGIQAYVEHFGKNDSTYRNVSKFVKYSLGIMGYIIFAYVFYQTFIHYIDFFSTRTIILFILPIILSISVLPYIYLLAVFSAYEIIYGRLSFLIKDPILRKKAKTEIFLFAKFSLNKVNEVNKKFKKHDVNNTKDIRNYIRGL